MKCLLKECCLGGQESTFQAHHCCCHFLSLVLHLLYFDREKTYGKRVCLFSPLYNCATLPSRKMAQRSPNPFLSHVSCFRTNCISLVVFFFFFSVSSCVGRRATSGLSLGIMPGLGQLSPSDAHTLHLNLGFIVSLSLSWDPGQEGINREMSDST